MTIQNFIGEYFLHLVLLGLSIGGAIGMLYGFNKVKKELAQSPDGEQEVNK